MSFVLSYYLNKYLNKKSHQTTVLNVIAGVVIYILLYCYSLFYNPTLLHLLHNSLIYIVIVDLIVMTFLTYREPVVSNVDIMHSPKIDMHFNNNTLPIQDPDDNVLNSDSDTSDDSDDESQSETSEFEDVISALPESENVKLQESDDVKLSENEDEDIDIDLEKSEQIFKNDIVDVKEEFQKNIQELVFDEVLPSITHAKKIVKKRGRKPKTDNVSLTERDTSSLHEDKTSRIIEIVDTLVELSDESSIL
jgi:hypothetical protein